MVMVVIQLHGILILFERQNVFHEFVFKVKLASLDPSPFRIFEVIVRQCLPSTVKLEVDVGGTSCIASGKDTVECYMTRSIADLHAT